jgi:hypothetical protein
VAQLGVRLRLWRREVLHVADVRAGDEGVLARAREDERASALVLRLVEGFFDGGQRVDVERVEPVGSVDGQGRHVVGERQPDGLPVGHT